MSTMYQSHYLCYICPMAEQIEESMHCGHLLT